MFDNMTLSRDDINAIYIPVGSMPPSKTDAYLKNMLSQFEPYPVVLIAIHDSTLTDVDMVRTMETVGLKLKQLGV